MLSLSSPPRLWPRVIYCSGTPGESLETTRASPPTSWDQPGHCPPLKGSSTYDESLLHVQNFEYQVQVEIKVPVLFRRYIEVHGRPSPVTFLPGTPRHPHQMLLRWKVLSHSPVSLFTLLYRKAGDAEWTTVRVGASHQSNQPDSEVHEASSLIENLEASSTYEALVQAKNSYGWSQPSRIEVIHTPAEGGKSAESLWSGGLHYSSGQTTIRTNMFQLVFTLCPLFSSFI